MIQNVVSAIPDSAVYLSSSSGNVANASAVATLTAPTGKTAYLSQFTVTAAGSTAGLAVNVTITGCVGGTQTYTFTFPVGVLVGAVPLDVDLAIPLIATGPNVNIVVTCPAGGSGNTNASVCASGFAA